VIVPKMEHIEEALYRSKTKLNAALARSRIKSRVLSIDWLLPDSVRKNEKIGCRMHVTCWVNCVKTRCAVRFGKVLRTKQHKQLTHRNTKMQVKKLQIKNTN